jgi:ankyrin repeat protein
MRDDKDPTQYLQYIKMPQDQKNDRLLLQACIEKNVADVAQYLRQGANPNCKDKFGNKPLSLLLQCHISAIHNHRFSNLDSPADLLPGIEVLLKAGAKIDTRSSEGTTPLYNAIDSCNSVAALQLIEAGANVNSKDRQGKSLLMIAVQKNLEEIVYSLLENGADTLIQCKAGRQVLYDLHIDASVTLVSTLVKYGADPTADNSHCLYKVVRFKAARFNDFALAYNLVTLGAEVDSRSNARNETPLMYLARYGRTDEDLLEAKAWIKLGASLKLTNNLNQTAFDIAQECENGNIIRLLGSSETS